MRKGKVLLLSLLALVCLVTLVSVSYARYRYDQTENIVYTTAQPAQVYLGKMTTAANGVPLFDPEASGSWETVGAVSKLEFTVANGTTAKSYAKKDLVFTLHIIGGLGLGSAEAAPITLHIPQAGTEALTIVGTASRILPDSPMYHTYGDGWIYSFLDEEGQELSWELKGDKFSVVALTITVESEVMLDDALLRTVVTGEVISE